MTNEQAIEVINGHIKDSSIAYGTFTGQALRMAIEALKAQLSQVGTTKDATTDLQSTCNDAISRKAVKDLLIYNWDECCSACIGEVEEMPSVTQELLYRGAISLDKQEILQAGYEGREYDFYIGGRLFAVREKAQ